MCAGAARRLDSAWQHGVQSWLRELHGLSRSRQIILYPGGIDETEILLVFGGVSFACKMGQLAGNHFITLTSGLENLAELGRLNL